MDARYKQKNEESKSSKGQTSSAGSPGSTSPLPLPQRHSKSTSKLVVHGQGGFGDYWKAAKASSGKTYYYNTMTGHTSWEVPVSISSAIKAGAEDAGGTGAASASDAQSQRGIPRARSFDGAFRDLKFGTNEYAPSNASDAKYEQQSSPRSVGTPDSMSGRNANASVAISPSPALEPRKTKRTYSKGIAFVKQPLLRSLMSLDAVAGSSGWHYVDGGQKQFGPFPEGTMQAWYEGGYLHQQQLVARTKEGPYVAISELTGGQNNGFVLSPLEELQAARSQLLALLE